MSSISEFEIEVNGKIYETNTGEVLTDVSDSGKIRNWDEKKKLNLQMAELYLKAMRIDDTVMTPARLMQMRNCASYLVFGDVGGKKKLTDANFCRVRLCPVCNWRKSLKNRSTMCKWVL